MKLTFQSWFVRVRQLKIVQAQFLMSQEPQSRSDPEAHIGVAARVRLTKPYDPVSSLHAIASNPRIVHYKLDWNESTIAPSPKVFEALRRFLNGDSRIEWYPDLGHDDLYQKIAEYVGCRTEQVLITNGSDDALNLICQTYLDSGDGVVAPFPTYTHFLQFAELAGADLRMIRKEDPFSISLREIGLAIDDRTKIVYLANPNNPTGALLKPTGIHQLADRHPRVLFLVDEAYFEFSGSSCTRFIGYAPNVVVTRSFSKCFGLAGLRIGYVVASESIIRDLRRVHNPKSVNKMAQVAAAAALGDRDYYRDYVAEVKRAAAMIKRFCDERCIACRISHANFVLIQLENPEWFVGRLHEAGVHVRDRSAQLPGTIRLTVGTSEQMQEVLWRLRDVMNEFHLRQASSSSLRPKPVRLKRIEKRSEGDPPAARVNSALRP